MKIKNLLALLLTLVLILSVFTACTSEEAPIDPTNSSDAGNSDPGADDEDPDEPVTELEFWWIDYGGSQGSGAKVELVEQAINEKLEKELNVHLNFTWLQIGDYGTQLMLAIANNEQVDLAVTQPATNNSFLTQYSNGSMLDISALIDTYGQELKELVGEEILASATVDGKLYMIPAYRQLGSNMYLCYRTDILEQAGVLDAFNNIVTWADFENVMQAIKGSDTTAYAIGGTTNNATIVQSYVFDSVNFEGSAFDNLGDSLGVVFSDQTGNVSNWLANDAYIAFAKRAAEWSALGYVWPDSAYSQDDANQLVGQNVFAGVLTGSEYGVEINKAQSMGTAVSCHRVGTGMVSTGSCRNFGSFIPVTAANPEKAMQVLNLIYTDAELMNLLIWGIEGETYVVEDGVAKYPDGTDTSTCGYHGRDFTLGNQYLLYPWDGLPADFREKALDDFLGMPRSNYLGIAVDTSALSSIISGITAVKDEFVLQMSNGNYTDAMHAECMEKLQAAGIDEYLALYQNAVTDWMA